MPDTLQQQPSLLWLRRDLRLDDHPGWAAALAGGGPVVPVFIRDPLFDEMTGAAARWRMGEAIAALDRQLRARGSRLILRQGDALGVLRDLIAETGAGAVIWSRAYDARQIARDTQIRASLTGQGVNAASVNAHLLFEPWTVATRAGGPFRVYSPFWRGVREREVAPPLPPPGDLAPPAVWPRSDDLGDWALGRAMNRGGAIVMRHAGIGEAAARSRLSAFLGGPIERYRGDRDFPARAATSGLSENLAYGEISPRVIWHAGRDAMISAEKPGQAEHFLKELVWREFAYHLLYHFPQIETHNWRSDWDSFPWREDNGDARLWRQGRTGVALVDAAMREMYVTGRMHNRLRMLAASFLTKHLMTHWRVGQGWFAECLTDWDVAANAMGWQWVAGSGPDAAPYFRVFNPDLQAEKFDADGAYRARWLAEGRGDPHPDALSYFDAVPRAWALDAAGPAPEPMISLAQGRARALEAYSARVAAE
ncbi:MAG: deoxyribodipyrimidine photo-lyase [Pseudomonadota bacterium]